MKFDELPIQIKCKIIDAIIVKMFESASNAKTYGSGYRNKPVYLKFVPQTLLTKPKYMGIKTSIIQYNLYFCLLDVLLF